MGDGSGTRWAMVNARKQLKEAQAEILRLRERIAHLEGVVLDLGGDPSA